MFGFRKAGVGVEQYCLFSSSSSLSFYLGRHLTMFCMDFHQIECMNRKLSKLPLITENNSTILFKLIYWIYIEETFVVSTIYQFSSCNAKKCERIFDQQFKKKYYNTRNLFIGSARKYAVLNFNNFIQLFLLYDLIMIPKFLSIYYRNEK